MIIYDPFYGVSDAGNIVARGMNRLLLLAEASAVILLVCYQVSTGRFGWWFWIALPFALKIGLTVVNGTLRLLWNVLLVLIHGTADIPSRKGGR